MLRGMAGPPQQDRRILGLSIAQARVDNPDIDYRDFDGSNFPFENASFDLVTAICVMHHVAPAEWTHFMYARCGAWCGPGGWSA